MFPTTTALACAVLALVAKPDATPAPDRGPIPVGSEVVLRLVDGRQPRGTLDPATDDERIVLSTEWPGARMTSSFSRGRVLELWDAAVHDAVRGTGLLVIDGHALAGDPAFDAPPPEWPLVLPHEPPRPIVASIFVRGEVANWDRDAEPDGLLVQVVPLDAYGRPVPAAGSLSATLIAQRYRFGRPPALHVFDRPFFEAERWTEPVDEFDFGPEGAFVKLPFRRLRPERDLDVASPALLRVRLVVRGTGSFEAEDADVRLRRSSRFRDELEQLVGRRTVRDPFSRDP